MIDGFNASGICVVCLNHGRKMYSSEKIKECFKLIADIIIPNNLIIKVCWECYAYIENVFKLKNMIQNSYNILNDYAMKNKYIESPADIYKHATQRLKPLVYEPHSFVTNYEVPISHETRVGNDHCTTSAENELPIEIKKELSPEPTIDNEGMIELEVPIADALSDTRTSMQHNNKKTKISKKSLDRSSTLIFTTDSNKLGTAKSKTVGTLRYAYNCPDCPYRTNEESYYNTHKCKGKTSELRYKLPLFLCPFCSFSCKIRANLKMHVDKHRPKETFMCQYCPYLGKSQRALNLHLLSHGIKSTLRTHRCILCPETFTIRAQLYQHLDFVHAAQSSFSNQT